MIVIEPNIIYSREDLVRAFAEHGADWDTVRARLGDGLRKLNRKLIYGKDLLAALDSLPGRSGSNGGGSAATSAKRGRPRKVGAGDEWSNQSWGIGAGQ
jgi:hypothetical protein